MHAGTSLERPCQPLVVWLARRDVEFEIHGHEPVFTRPGPLDE